MTLFIPTYGRLELLNQAIESLKPLLRTDIRIVVCDNSLRGTVKVEQPLEHVRNPIRMSYHQTMNYFAYLSAERGEEWFIYMHDDLVVNDPIGLVNEFKKHMDNPGVASIMAQPGYPLFWALRVSVHAKIGGFDTDFPNSIYHSDVDYERRVALAGCKSIGVNWNVTHLNGGSNTIKVAERARYNALTFPMNEVYYAAKWGGPMGSEKFNTPWNE